jgi:K+-sensing histidine kinase KdpD
VAAVQRISSETARLQRPTLRTAAGVCVALAGPAVVTLLAFGNPHEALPALLYVLVVLFATSLGGRAPGLVAAAVSIVPFYYFFLVPHHTWAVKSEGAVALAVFILTGVLGGEVLARQRGARTRAEAEASSRMHALDTALRLQFVADALVSARTRCSSRACARPRPAAGSSPR